MARSATSLHDQRKYGGPKDDDNDTCQKDYGVLMANVIQTKSSLPNRIGDPVEMHMGPFDEERHLTDDLEKLVHFAEMSASDPLPCTTSTGRCRSSSETVRSCRSTRGPLSRVEVLDDTDEIRVFDVLMGDQQATFKAEAIEAARRGVTIE